MLNGNSLSEGLCAEQPAEEQPEKADVKSEIKEKVIGEPEEEKLGEVVDDDALGADWGLVINQADLIFECLCHICMLLKIQWCCTKQPIANLRCRTGPNIFRRYADDDFLTIFIINIGMPPHMGSYLVDQLICICIFNCGDHPCGAVDIFFSDFKLYCHKKIGPIFRNICAMNIKME